MITLTDMKSTEAKRLLSKLGAVFESGKGGHLRVELNGKRSVLPMHSKELGKELWQSIQKQLGIKQGKE